MVGSVGGPHFEVEHYHEAGMAAAIELAIAMGDDKTLANGNKLLKHCQSAISYVDSDSKDGSAFSTGYCFGIINGVSSLRVVTNPPQAASGMPVT